jgi:hypothetical protein
VDKQQNIPFIHNYCDRWCERCEFTTRCAVFERENELFDQNHDITQKEFWQNLANIFDETKQLLYKIAEENNIDSDAIDYTEIEAEKRQKRERVNQESLHNLSRDYYKKVDKLLENKDLLASTDEQTKNEMLPIISWYQYFISAKIQRGLLSADDDFDEDFPRDCDGSIKIALIAIERSIMAWTALLSAENSSKLTPIILLLKTIRRNCEEKFPNARDFMRPGFDEIETIM